jgi:hypothetical protein
MFNAVVKNLILNATKTCGADVDRIICFIMEQLTPDEYDEVKKFLTWSFTKKKFFGHGNFEDRVAEFEKETT